MSLENTALNLVEDEFVDELKPGTELMLGQYKIEGFLAAGGFGITYLAKDSLGRRVVIKECFPGNFCRRQNASVMPRSRAHQADLKSIVRLFLQEALNLAKANHPNIVGVHQVFEENNTAYMALDYVHGHDLLELLEDDPDRLKPELVEGYLKKILDAIGHIHKMGMLHRDISPDNIIISNSGEPILIDFGAARESKDERATRMLSALRVVKDGYSPQEFYIAGSDQPPSCDLYSLAASFYHVITKELPPDSQWRLSASAAGDPDPYVSLGLKTNAYSQNFVEALDKALSVLPRQRMQRAEDWLAYLENGAAAETVKKITPAKVASADASSKEKASKPKPIKPILLGTSGLVAAGLAFAFISTADNDTAVGAVEAPTVVEERAAAVDTGAVPDLAQPQVGAIDEPDFAGTDQVTSVPLIARPAPSAAPKQRQLSALGSPLLDSFPAVEQSAPQRSSKVLPAPEVEPQPEESLASGMSQTPETADVNSAEFFMALAKSQSNEVTAPVSRPNRAQTGSANGIMPVITRITPKTPFMLSDAEPGVIAAVATDAPDWLADNMRIVSIDGIATESNEAILARLDERAAQTDDSEFTVKLGIVSSLNGTVFERELPISNQRHTLLLNGLHFVTRETEAGWATVVLEAPASSNFAPGDTLISFVTTWEDLDGPDSLKTILERELASGNSRFNFAVERDGEIWIEAFNLASK